jgi:uncharacterized protein YuzE
MQLHYDKVTDAIYLKIADDPIIESEEVHPGVVLDFDAHGNVVAVEVYRAGGKRAQTKSEPAHGTQTLTNELTTDLRALRDQLHAQGIAPFTVDEFDRELAERRGE